MEIGLKKYKQMDKFLQKLSRLEEKYYFSIQNIQSELGNCSLEEAKAYLEYINNYSPSLLKRYNSYLKLYEDIFKPTDYTPVFLNNGGFKRLYYKNKEKRKYSLVSHLSPNE